MDSSNKHKSANIFRFKSFTDHINEVDIRRTALYYVGHANEEFPDKDETHFHQILRKWTTLNVTDEYKEFKKKCQNIVTLPQLLHNKDYVMKLVLDELKNPKTLSLQPFLELLVVLGKDLREDFYVYFEIVLEKLISILKSRDAQQIEWTFTCLAFLFKTLKSYLKRDIAAVFNNIFPLLDCTKQPEYIVNFAIECVAFIARDLKNHANLISIILKIARKGGYYVQRCGRILMEICRGVNGKFHSNALKLLKNLFISLLEESKYDTELLFEIILISVEEILHFVHQNYIHEFWSILIEVVDFAAKTRKTNLRKLIQIMIFITEYKNGQFVSVDLIVPVISKLTESIKDQRTLIMLAQTASSILLSNTGKISQLEVSRLTHKVLENSDPVTFEEFVLNMCNHTQFETIIFPRFQKYFEINFSLRTIDILSKIIMKKSPPCREGTNIHKWKKYPITFTVPTTKKIEKLLWDFNIYDESNAVLKMEEFLLVASLYPHIMNMNLEKVNAKLKNCVVDICDRIMIYKKTKQQQIERMLFALSILVESLVHCNCALGDIYEKIIFTVLPYCKSETFTGPLQTLDLLFCNESFKHGNVLDLKLFERIHAELSDNLFSTSHTSRLLSSHIFNVLLQETSDTMVYKIIFDVESIKPDVHTYREQLIILQNLSTDGGIFKNIKYDFVKIDCLKFFFGLLFHNFKLLWEPTANLIEEYFHKLDVSKFWCIFGKRLEQIASKIKTSNEKLNLLFRKEKYFENACLDNLIIKDFDFNMKFDLINYRNLLWKDIPKYGQLSEVKNRELVTLFLNFIRDEYRSSNASKFQVRNIKNDDEGITLDKEDSDDEDKNEYVPMKKSKLESKNMKEITTTLITKLKVFSKMKNPKHLYKGTELYSFYLELLMNTNAELQKIALDCIMAYNEKFLIPYKNHLYNLIDEQKFKDEMASFKLEKDANNIQEEHRTDLIPIILKILYGKISMKISAKNINSQTRKCLVLKFLGGCEKDEIMSFLSLVFNSYEGILKEDFSNIVIKINQECNIENMWSAKKLQKTLNLIDLMRKQFGGFMHSDILDYILKIIIFIGATCEKALINTNDVNIRFKSMFKNLKSSCILSLVSFFETFHDYVWKTESLAIIYNVFVWPNIGKLSEECIHSPTPILKLLSTWSLNSYYFSFYMKNNPATNMSSLSYLVNMLSIQKAKPNIHEFIMDIIERLLLEDFYDKDSSNTIPGVTLIMPFVSKILDRYTYLLNKVGLHYQLKKRDLVIISCICNYIREQDTCEQLVDILLPILHKNIKKNNTENVTQLTSTLANLIEKCKFPAKFIKKFAPLFGQISTLNARKILCEILQKIEKKSLEDRYDLNGISDIVFKLNALDGRWVEQPDYEKRFGALREISTKLEQSNITMELGLVVIYNCFHFIKNDKDIGMRSYCNEHLKKLIPVLIEKNCGNEIDSNFLIGEVILNTVRQFLREKNDDTINDGLQLLGHLARRCSSRHPVLKDLNLLTDANDAEVDFFENITHLQIHRHSRALLKFCSIAKSCQNSFNVRTLTQFILPLSSRYLLNEKFCGKHILIDAAIETVGVVCQLLSWHHYQSILKYYLQKMRFGREHHKQSVRIVMTILDAFHFDLSKAITNLKLNSEHLDKKNLLMFSEKSCNTTKNCGDVENSDSELDKGYEINLGKDEIFGRRDEKTFTRTITLPLSAARNVIHVISSVLIPTLNRSITEISIYDNKHKINKRKRSIEREEEETLRVPIALAVVKLLQKLPREILVSNIPGVLTKVCTFLKSPLKSVRMLTRDILKKIMLCLGSEYLALLLDQMCSLLTRGFQVHVLSVTVHGILDALKENLVPSDLERCLNNILKIALNDIFGEVAIEKEINKICLHTPEAKPSNKSYLTLNIIARNVRENCLLDIIMPFKVYLSQSQSKKIILNINTCFQKIVHGLVENKNISREDLLIFIYGITSESINDIIPRNTELKKVEREKTEKPDCFLIPLCPNNRNSISKISKRNTQASAHVFVEFGLQLLHLILKRRKITEVNYESFLNPIVPILKDSLNSSYIRIATFSLKCVAAIWNSMCIPEKMIELTDNIVQNIFKILYKNSSSNITLKDDNYILVKSAFKSLVVLLRKCEYYNISDDCLVQLLYYIEQNIYSAEKHPVGFTLLKSIVGRKLDVPEIHKIVKKLCEIAIISESDYAKTEARTILLNYLLEYKKKKKINLILKFFVNHLKYELPSGRLSSILFLHSVIKKLRLAKLKRRAEFLFLSLGTRLINEEMPDCRFATAKCIEEIISRLDQDYRLKLLDINLLMFDNDKSTVREMAAVLCSRFIEVEKETFLDKAKRIFPIIASKFCSNGGCENGKYVLLQKSKVTEESNLFNKEKNRIVAHELIQMGNCILKMHDNCSNIFTDNDLSDVTDKLAYDSQKLLAHEHEWVRLNAVKILNRILSTYDYGLVREILLGRIANNSGRYFIFSNPELDIKSLCLDLCAQLQPNVAIIDMAMEITEIFLRIGSILKNVSINDCKINLSWLVRRMRHIVHNEVVKTPKTFVLRQAVFNWVEGLLTLIDTSTVQNMSPTFLQLLQREISEDNANKDHNISQQALRICKKIRKRIGDEIYDKIWASVQSCLLIKKARRKKIIAQEKIFDPIRAAKRKRSQLERRKFSKRRKVNIARNKSDVTIALK